MTVAELTEPESHSPLDAMLGAAPRGIMRHWLTWLILVLAALGTLAFFVRFVTGGDSPYYSAPVERGDVVPRVSERGQVRGSGEVTVAAAIRGRVMWVSNKSYGEVEKDELLATIDASQIARSIAIEQSRLLVAQTALKAAKLSAQDAGARLGRFERVWKASGGRAPSLNEVEGARVDASRADLGVEAARAAATAAGLQLKDAKTQLVNTEVRAPIAGTLVKRQVQPGQTVAENQPMFTIAAGLAPLTIEVPLIARPGTLVKAGTTAQVRFDDLPDTPQSATLALQGVGPASTVFTIEQPDPRIRPGMVATVEIELPERQNVLLVPDAALAFEPVDREQERPGTRRERIYVLDGSDPRKVYVTVGGSDGKRSEVFANDLKPDDRVIIGWRDTRSGSDRSRR